MKFLEPMIVAFSMYSKIPMPRIEWNKENMKYTMFLSADRCCDRSTHLSGRNVS